MNSFALVGLVVSVASILLCAYSLLNAHNKIQFIWGCFSFSVALWGFGIYKIAMATIIEDSIFRWRIAEIGVIFIPILLIHFVFEYLQLKRSKPLIVFYSLALAFVFFDLFTDYFFGPVRYAFDQFYYITSTPLYSLFLLMFFGLAGYATLVLCFEYNKKDLLMKKQIIFFVFAFVVGFIGGASSYLPVYGIDIYPIYNFTIFISAFLVAYSIFKHHLFNIKVVAAELLTFAIWIAVLSQAIMADTFNGKLLGFGTLLFAVVLGIFLIKSVKKEVAQREQIEELAGRLKSVNRIMSHDIKNVLGKNKDMYGMLLDGTFGVIPDGAKPFLERLLCDTKQLVRSVISILESGQEFTLKLAPFDAKAPILEIINDVKHDAEEKGLTIKTDIDESQDYTILGDEAQLSTRVFRNLIENAVNYTLAGSVTVGLMKKAGRVIFTVSDTGVGITEEDQKNLFKEGGHGKDSLKVNVHSTGYGLFSAKKVVDAHKGKIWFETEQGSGTVFLVEFLSGREG